MLSSVPRRCWRQGTLQQGDMATARYERSGTKASAHPDPDPDPELRIKSPNSVPDPSVPDHRMQYLKSDVELGVRSMPVPYPFQTKQSN